MAIQKVTLVGATGILGVPLLAALKQHFRVQIVTRDSSKSSVADDSGVDVVRVSDDYPVSELETIFKGQDAVVSTITASSAGIQLNIVDAAHKAGVRRFIPSEFGLDTTEPNLRYFLPRLTDKAKVLKRLQTITESDPEGTFSWTGIATGLFFDWALHANFMHFDLKKRQALLLDQGNQKFSTSTMATIVEAVAQVLLRENETRNKFLYIQSFSVTPNEVLNALQKSTSETWKVEHVNGKEYLADSLKQQNSGKMEGLYNTIYALGIMKVGFETRIGFANELLGLETLDLDKEVAKVVQEFSPETQVFG